MISKKEVRKDYLNKRFNIKSIFKRFNQKNDIFNRSMWDDKINPKNIQKKRINIQQQEIKTIVNAAYAFLP